MKLRALAPRRKPFVSPRRPWRFIVGDILVRILKGLAVLTVALLVIGNLSAADDNRAGLFSALFVIGLSCVSLAYLLYVSSQVHLSIPGFDEADEDRKDVTVTIHVTRLSAKAARARVVNDAVLPVLRAQTRLALTHEPEGAPAEGTREIALVTSEPFSLRARASSPAAMRHVFDHVGIYRLSSAGVRVYGLLCVLSRVCGTPGSWRVRVVPNIYRLTRGVPWQRRVTQTSLGLPGSPADALDYDRVRDYQPGDPLKTIHWKLVAHSQGELYTKLFETPTVTSVTLLIDPYGPAPSNSSEDAFDLYDTMLEGAFSLLEHARENGIACQLRFVNHTGAFVEVPWTGPGMLGWFVETARRPTRAHEAAIQSTQAIRSLRDGHAGYTIVATSALMERTVQELVACHSAGIPLQVVHALPFFRVEEIQQRAFDERLRDASIDVIGLTNGSQIVREVNAS